MKIVGKPLEYFAENGTGAANAMAAFKEWVEKNCSDSPVFVGFNAAFDWGFVNWYFLQYVGSNPFGFAPLDIKAYFAGASGVDWDDTRSSRLPQEVRAKNPDEHDALSDAVAQAATFKNIRAKYGSRHRRPQTIPEHLEKLKERANLQASCHAVLRDYHAAWNFWLTIFAVVPTATLLIFPLVTDDFIVSGLHLTPAAFKVLNAAVALFAFVMVLIQMIWRPDSIAKSHKRAVEHFVAAKYAVRMLLEKVTVTQDDVRRLEEEYLDVRWLPVIEDHRFLELKQRHLQKMKLSKRLDKDPWFKLPKFGLSDDEW